MYYAFNSSLEHIVGFLGLALTILDTLSYLKAALMEYVFSLLANQTVVD